MAIRASRPDAAAQGLTRHTGLARCVSGPPGHSLGFTLLELLVVMAIMAMAVAGASFALRDSSHTALEREAQRLIAQLESGRALARTTGQTLYWRPVEGGYFFEGAATGDTRQAWLTPNVQVQWPAKAPVAALLLGPEPVLPAQAITLRLADTSVRIASDGLRPFAVEAQP